MRVVEKSNEQTRRLKIVIHGAVQGVGFRPFVYRLANELHVNGWVNNSSSGVCIEAESDRDTLETFLTRLHNEKPPHAVIQQSETTFLETLGYKNFSIRESNSAEEKSALILPDIAVCDDCLHEMLDPANRRYRYPFINCTHCGPRFSIIESLPYDRPNTTMKKFSMCPECEQEYHDPENRRFHAQPIACPKCGPHVELWDRDGKKLFLHDEAIIEASKALCSGKIVALKGLGGFQLLVNSTNEDAVNELRLRKHREEKPFAIMFRSLDKIKEECFVSKLEIQLLKSAESPIVLLRRKSTAENLKSNVAPSIAPRNPYLGIMLPYTPLHHLLMREIDFPIIATSGNISDEPMCIDESDALKKLNSIADLFLIHNRPIQRYVDDSIMRVVLNRDMMVRRARGFAPMPITSTFFTKEPILAVGGHLKNTVALQKQNSIFISQHIGDLETVPALDCFKNTIEDFKNLYEAAPSLIIHDKHPNYISTAYAKELPGEKKSGQHHVAHVASCMAEHDLNEPLLGVSWDGTGFGDDGTIWGGEFIEFTGKNFLRIGSFRPFHLPGGDAAVKESIRSAIGMMYELFEKKVFKQKTLAKLLSPQEERLVVQMIDKKINAPLTSSVGRMFDAIGVLLGLRVRANFEGQTAMEVEFAAHGSNDKGVYPFEIVHGESLRYVVDWRPMIKNLLDDIQQNVSRNAIAKRFHNTLTEIIIAISKHCGYDKIVLSGGCFQNALLLERTVTRLREEKFIPYWHQRIPTNDGGISLGQVYAVALEKHFTYSTMR